MDELVRWLREQLDEETEAAQLAFSGQADPENGWGAHRPEWQKQTTITPHVGVIHEAVQADHIVRWNPARVLAEINAKRQLLDDYTVTAHIRDEAAERIKASGDHPDAKDLETWDRAQREAAILEGPVKLAALPLADRPGYREEWRP